MRRPPIPTHQQKPTTRPLRHNGWLASGADHADSAMTEGDSKPPATLLSSSSSLQPTTQQTAVQVALVKQRLVNALGREGALLRLSELLVPLVRLRFRRKQRAKLANAFTPKQIVSVIRRSDISFFDSWCAADLAELAKQSKQLQYRLNEWIVLPNEPSMSCGIVVVMSGECEVSSMRHKKKRKASSPVALGIAAVVGEGLNDVMVRAASSTVVVASIPLNAVRKMMGGFFRGRSSSTEMVESLKVFVSMRNQSLLDQFYATPLSLSACSWLLGSMTESALRKLADSGMIGCATYLPGSSVPLGNDTRSASHNHSPQPFITIIVRGMVRASTSDGGCHTLWPGSCIGELSCIAQHGHSSLFEDPHSICSLAVDADSGPCDVWRLSAADLHAFAASELPEENRLHLMESFVAMRQAWFAKALQSSRKSLGKNMRLLPLLRDVPCLCHCSDTVLAELCGTATPKFFPRGTIIVSESDETSASCLWLIVQGIAEEIELNGLHFPGSPIPSSAVPTHRTTFGEYFLVPHKWNASLVARSNVDAFVVTAASAVTILEKCQGLKQAQDVCNQGVDLLHRRVQQQTPPPPSPQPPVGLAPDRTGSADSAPGRGRRPSGNRQLIPPYQTPSAPQLRSVETITVPFPKATLASEIAANLWAVWTADISQRGAKPVLPTTTQPREKPRRSYRSSPLPSRGTTTEWSCARGPDLPLSCYTDHSLRILLGTPSRYKKSSMLSMRSESVDDPLESASLIQNNAEDSIMSVPSTVLSFLQTTTLAVPGAVEVLGVAAQPFGQEAHIPMVIESDDGCAPTASTQQWNCLPSPPPPSVTPPRPHTTGGTPKFAGEPSPFQRTTIVGNSIGSPRPLPPSSPARPITTGSMALKVTTPPTKDEQHRSGSHDPLVSPPLMNENIRVLSPPLLSTTMLQMEGSQTDEAGSRTLSPSSLAAENPQSNRRNDPRARERTISVTSASQQRTLRPFSAQSRGQPSPLDRMVQQRSIALDEMSVGQPDSIWNTFLSFDKSSGGQASVNMEALPQEQPRDSVISHPLLTMDDDDDRPLHRSTTAAATKKHMKPLVLLVHILGCQNLDGCDSLVEPVVRVSGSGGKHYMTTPVLTNLTHPSWTIEQASFITVLLKRDELRFTLCDAQSSGEGEVLYFSTMPTVDLESVSGTGTRTLVWLSPAGRQLQSTLSLRVMVTCPDLHGSDASHAGLVPSNAHEDRFSGNYSVLVAMCDVSLGTSPEPGLASPKGGGVVSAELRVDEAIVLSCTASAHAQRVGVHLVSSFGLESSSCTLSCEGGFLEIILRKGGVSVGRTVASIDDLAFSGPGIRTLSITTTTPIKGGKKAKHAIGSLRLLVLQVGMHGSPSTGGTHASAEPLSLVSVRSFDGGDSINAPWQPDPFVTVFRGSAEPLEENQRADRLLVRSSLVFSEARPQWPVHDASCVLSPKTEEELYISVCDNDASNRIAGAVIVVAPGVHGRQHVVPHYNKMSGSGVLIVDVASLPLMRIGAAVKKLVVQRNHDPSIPEEGGSQKGAPVLVVHVASCASLRGAGGATTDPIVTARFDHCARHLMRSLTRFHTDAPSWSPVDGAAFAVDLSSCCASGSTPQLVFEAWNGGVQASNLIGVASVSLRTLVSSGRTSHVLNLRSALGASIAIETLLTHPGSPPFGVNPSHDTELLLNALALLDDEDEGSSTTLDKLDLSISESLRSGVRNDSFSVRRVVPVRISILGCSHLARQEGHPFIVTQQGGNVLHTTPVALLGDMSNPVWKPEPGTSLLHTLPVASRTKRFVEDAPLTFVVMWQHGRQVLELSRASVSLASLLNAGGYVAGTTSQATPSSSATSMSPTMLKSVELRHVTSDSEEASEGKSTLQLMISHEEL